ncbi:beta-galactosidase [Colwellia piezophila]|uniref:beta-galactosidase n=1 Tax=Colwellia piezophila TaxID=211668 RepID=UPI0003797548|nr:beta-galactosidase [Colwellia piezophila]
MKSNEILIELFTSKGKMGWPRAVGSRLINALVNASSNVKLIAKTMIALTAISFSIEANEQVPSALPLDAYGVWDRSAISLTDDKYLHLFKGLQLGYDWSDIEPVNGVYDWTQLDQEIQFAYDNGLYAYLSVNAGPDCPDWVYNTVPKMLTDFGGHGWDGDFPYYYHEDYITHYNDMITNLATHIASLEPELREKIAFLQVKTGATGDETPSHGVYLQNSPYKIAIKDTDWQSFRIAAFQHHKEKFVDSGLGIPLLFNNIDADKDEQRAAWRWVSKNVGSGFGIKGSAYVRGHHLTGEGYLKNKWYDNLVNPTTLPLFSRSEMDQSHTRPLYLINKPLGFYWGVLSGLNTGLSVFDVTKSAIDALTDYPEIIPSLEFFNRYAPEIYPSTTKGAYSIFHEGLNSADAVKFPPSEYGINSKAKRSDQQRYQDICNDSVYAARGAQCDDLYGATKGQVYQREDQTGYNDAGWDIHDGNFERWIEQIDPDGTSIGLFRLNADAQGLLNENNSIYDRFARSFDTANDKDTMYFKFHEHVFSETVGQPDVITLELIWLDKNAGSTWELRYDAGQDNIKTAHAAKGDGDNKWKTITVTLSDAVMNNNGPNGADFILVNTDDIDDIFHGFEAKITRKLSPSDDTDGDGVANDDDAFPNDSSEWLDTDEDGVGDNTDACPNDATETLDDDNDGYCNGKDAFPNDSSEWLDTDGDSVGDNEDACPNDADETLDTDGDTYCNGKDAFPNDQAEWLDTDGDSVGDNADAFPADATESKDSDGDGVGDNGDAFPADATESKDSDGDGVGDNGDAFPADVSESKDSDGDGIGDNADVSQPSPAKSGGSFEFISVLSLLGLAMFRNRKSKNRKFKGKNVQVHMKKSQR